MSAYVFERHYFESKALFNVDNSFDEAMICKYLTLLKMSPLMVCPKINKFMGIRTENQFIYSQKYLCI